MQNQIIENPMAIEENSTSSVSTTSSGKQKAVWFKLQIQLLRQR